MLHKFKVKSSGTIFYYSNITNALYTKDKKMISKPLGVRENHQAPNMVSETGDIFKTRSPSEIKIVFGHKCNYACGYCVQRDVGDHAKDSKPNHTKIDKTSRATSLIRIMKSSLDLSNLEQMELWGGEILLYWKEVQEIIEAFDREDFDWVLPTNGTLLKPHHIEYFSKLKGRITIELSHDGPLHAKARGPEFLNRKADIFRLVEQYPEKIRITLNVVLTRENNDFFAINDFFRDFFETNNIKPMPITYMPVIVYDSFSKKHSFLHDLDQYRINLDNYLSELIKQWKKLGRVANDRLLQTSLFHVTEDGDDNNGILQWAGKMRSELDILDSSICGMHQMDKMVLDISGNIKSCQNVGSDSGNGNINQFLINDHPIKINGMNTNRGNAECEKCPVKIQCLKGCLLELDDESFEINCLLSKTHNMTMLLNAFKVFFDSDVEWLGGEDETEN